MNRPLTCFALAAASFVGVSAHELDVSRLPAHIDPFHALSFLQNPRASFTTASPGVQGQIREFNVVGRDHAFSPNRIEVAKDDLVKVTFTAADIAHSFTSDEYRISKRAGSGQTVTFEFRADRAGTFPFYCNLTADAKCRDMKGQLVVK
jgi:heme/copper-type cytochrome/quinol oxidase subunit 2